MTTQLNIWLKGKCFANIKRSEGESNITGLLSGFSEMSYSSFEFNPQMDKGWRN